MMVEWRLRLGKANVRQSGDAKLTALAITVGGGKLLWAQENRRDQLPARTAGFPSRSSGPAWDRGRASPRRSPRPCPAPASSRSRGSTPPFRRRGRRVPPGSSSPRRCDGFLTSLEPGGGFEDTRLHQFLCESVYRREGLKPLRHRGAVHAGVPGTFANSMT